MNVAIVGTGYVGLVAGACFADSGNEVWCVDIDANKVAQLQRGEIPIYEPGLDEMVKRNVEGQRLHFTTSLKDAVQRCQVIFIAVGTPQDEDGSADLRHVLAVARGIGEAMNGSKIIVDKSTVPVGTAEKVRGEISSKTSLPFYMVSNPEFLKEGSAIEDFMKPDRVVIGCDSDEARDAMTELYKPFMMQRNRILYMDIPSAEMTKYAANTMLALRISFMNEVANLCDQVGADVDKVRVGIGTDARIGMPFLFPGIGYGGSCFPKDVQAFIRTGTDAGVGMELSKAIEEVNSKQKSLLLKKIDKMFPQGIKGKKFAVWGLAFKPKTDDTREAPALTVIRGIIDRGATVAAYDPEATQTFAQRFGADASLSLSNSSYEALAGADALVICTEWREFSTPNFDRMKELMRGTVIFDGRNVYDPVKMKALGFAYDGIGRR